MTQAERLDVLCLGEAMGEIAFSPAGVPQVAVGGDTFNTAIYLARAGLRVGFASAVGEDPFGDLIQRSLRENDVSDRLLRRVPGAVTGLYAISNDASGERSFSYWRETSAARQCFAAPSQMWMEGLGETSLLYFSGISLFAFQADLDRLFASLSALRAAGLKIAFDGNFRPRLWPGDKARTQEIFRTAIALSDIYLPTYEDEALLWGDRSAANCCARLSEMGPKTIVVKDGANGCLIWAQDQLNTVPVPAQVSVVDTTAAGDSFNAAFLAGLQQGQPATEAALAGHRLAGQVIGYRGAILPA